MQRERRPSGGVTVPKRDHSHSGVAGSTVNGGSRFSIIKGSSPVDRNSFNKHGDGPWSPEVADEGWQADAELRVARAESSLVIERERAEAAERRLAEEEALVVEWRNSAMEASARAEAADRIKAAAEARAAEAEVKALACEARMAVHESQLKVLQEDIIKVQYGADAARVQKLEAVQQRVAAEQRAQYAERMLKSSDQRISCVEKGVEIAEKRANDRVRVVEKKISLAEKKADERVAAAEERAASCEYRAKTVISTFKRQSSRGTSPGSRGYASSTSSTLRSTPSGATSPGRVLYGGAGTSSQSSQFALDSHEPGSSRTSGSWRPKVLSDSDGIFAMRAMMRGADGPTSPQALPAPGQA